jgi:hypothetical protein
MKDDGSFRNQLPLTISALGADGETTTIVPEQTAPGTYRATFELPAEGTTIFAINSPDLPDSGYSFGHTRSYPREFLATDTNETLMRKLADLTGGAFAPTIADIWKRPEAPTWQRRDLTNWFLMAALALLPIDIWLRRRTWSA